jgi:WD40 repeat protein
MYDNADLWLSLLRKGAATAALIPMSREENAMLVDPVLVAGFRCFRPVLLYVGVALAAVLPQLPFRPAQAQTAASPPGGGRDGAARPATGGDVAPAELLRQLADNKLSPEQIAAAAEKVLRLQADEKTAWEPRWGDFLEHAHERGKLPADVWHKYLLGTVRLEVKVASEAKRADGLVIWHQFKGWRRGEHWSDVVMRGWREDEFSGIKLDPYRGTGYSVVYDRVSGGHGWLEQLADAGYASLKPGPQTYHYRYHVELLGDVPDDKVAEAKPLAERVIEGTLHWTLLADEQAYTPPALKADEALRPAVEKCLGAQALRDTRDPSLLELGIQADQPPVGMGFNVSLRTGRGTRPVGPVAFPNAFGCWAFNIDVPPGVESLDLVFTPSAAAAARLKHRNPLELSGLVSIWNGEVVLKDVKIHAQRLAGMLEVKPLNAQDAREDQTEQLHGNDPVIRQFKQGGDLATARRQLEQIVGKNPKNASAWFNLGCLTTASADWRRALDCFAKVKQLDPSSPLADKAQRQLRQIGGYFVDFVHYREDDAGAMCGLGMMYERGWGPKPDRQEAKKWYRNAANAGNAEAMCRLGVMYEQDLAAGQSNPKAQAWYRQQVLEMYRKAADLGNEEAKKWLATHAGHWLAAVSLLPGPPDSLASGRSPAAAATPSVDAAQARKEYQQWVEEYSRKSLDGLKLVITEVAEDDEADAQGENGSGGGCTYACAVSAEGAGSCVYHSVGGARGGGFTIAPDDVKRLNELLAKLPDDGLRLPPAGRRLLIQAAAGAKSIVKVYDRANAPDEVLEILRVSNSQIDAWMPGFQPNSEIDAGPYRHGGFLCLSPDGTQIIVSDGGSLQFWEPATHEPLGEIPARDLPLDEIAFSPDASLAATSDLGECGVLETRKWKDIRRFVEPVAGGLNGLSEPRFTPDGKYLVLQCSEPWDGIRPAPFALRIFDTRTWERVARLPDVPEDTAQYIPAPKKRCAVVRSKSGTISLWDLDRHAAVAELDKGCCVSQAAFAPDESLVAVVTTEKMGWGNPRLRLWKTGTGQFVHELRPFEQTDYEAVRGLLWSPDGKYLLAAIKGSVSNEDISVWNVKTGRHRGQFAESGGDVNGLVLLPDGSQLVAGCSDGRILFWDFPAAMKKIRDFEASLPPR